MGTDNTGNINQGNTGNAWLNFQFGNTNDADRLSGTPKTSVNLTLQSSLKESEVEKLIAAGFISSSGDPSIPNSVANPADGLRALSQLTDYAKMYNQVLEVNGLPGGTITITPEESDNNPVADEKINQLAQAFGVPPGFLLKFLQSQANTALNDKLAAQLTPEEANLVKFALLHPEAATNLSPKLKAILDQAIAETNALIGEMYGLNDWAGLTLDTTNIQAEFVADYQESFNEALEQAVRDGTITQAQASQIKNLFYGVKSNPPPDAATISQFTQIKEQAKAGIQSKYGFDADFSPEPEPTYYQSILDGAFLKAFTNALNNYTPSLTIEQKQTALQYTDAYLTNPDDPSIPADTKAILASTVQAANGAVIEKYMLEPTWTTGLKSISTPGIDTKALNFALGGLKTAQDLLSLMKEQVAKMPEGAEKANYLNYLSHISDALSKLEETIYALQASQAKGSKTLNALQMQIQLESLAKQQEATTAISEKRDKMSSIDIGLGPLNEIMDVVMKIVIVAFAAALSMCLGPAPLVFAIMYVSAPDKTIDKIFSGVRDGLVGLLGEKAGLATAGVINIFLSVIISCGNPFLVTNLITQNSGSIKDITKAAGGSETDAMIACAAIQAAAQVAMAIAMTVVTMGGGSGVAAASIIDTMGITASTLAKISKVAAITSTLVTLTMAGLTATKGYVDINNNLLQADIAILEGNILSYEERIKALIDVLKLLIKKMMEILNDNPEWLLKINEMRSTMYTQASQVTSEITA